MTTPFPLSRTKVELFLDCPRCFYLDRCLGIARPSIPPFNLNSAVDALPKTELAVTSGPSKRGRILTP